MPEQIWIGIDPGHTGAYAALIGERLVVFDAPTVKAKRGFDYVVPRMTYIVALTIGEREAIDPERELVVRCAIEEQGVRPEQHPMSAKKIGRGQGLWEGAVAMAGFAYELVLPQRWKRDMGIPAGSTKGASRALAMQLFPDYAALFKRVKDDGRAEAALIAEWRRRKG